MKKIKIQIVRRLMPLVYLTLFLYGIVVSSFEFIALMMLVSLLTGAFFCGWLCPFGAMQELMGTIGRKLKLPRFRVPQRVEKFLRLLRYMVLALSMTGLGIILFLTEPNSTFLAGLSGSVSYVTASAWILTGVLILLSLFVDRPFCRYLCSEGAMYGLVSMGRLFSIKRDSDVCIDCGLCDRICPMEVRISDRSHIRNPQCNNCFKCIDKCPASGVLSYGWAVKIRKNNRSDV